jgi:NTE family protein
MVKTRADFLAETPFSVSLSSGFFGFYAHVGFMKALDEKKLIPSLLSGSSAGALVAAAVASGNSIKEIVNLFVQFKKTDFWDPKLGFGFIQGQKIENLLNQHCVSNFSETKIPLRISVFNIKRFKTEVISEGSVARACRASASVPVLFHPVKIGKSYFWDGGVLDRPGHAGPVGLKENEMPSVVHYLHSRDWWGRIEDKLRYSKLHQSPFFFSTPSTYKVGPSLLTNGPEIIDYFYKSSKKWLEETLKK